MTEGEAEFVDLVETDPPHILVKHIDGDSYRFFLTKTQLLTLTKKALIALERQID